MVYTEVSPGGILHNHTAHRPLGSGLDNIPVCIPLPAGTRTGSTFIPDRTVSIEADKFVADAYLVVRVGVDDVTPRICVIPQCFIQKVHNRVEELTCFYELKRFDMIRCDNFYKVEPIGKVRN